jgi:hypothetical protein
VSKTFPQVAARNPTRRKPSRRLRREIRRVENLPAGCEKKSDTSKTFPQVCEKKSDASETFPQVAAGNPTRRKPSRRLRREIRRVGNLPAGCEKKSDASKTSPRVRILSPRR